MTIERVLHSWADYKEFNAFLFHNLNERCITPSEGKENHTFNLIQ